METCYPGDTATDLLAKAQTDFSDSSDSEDDDTDTSSFPALSRTSSRSSVSLGGSNAPSAQSIHALSTAAAEHEFQAEVTQSLERAFAEGHSVENAAVELKTLRMASNVDLRKVREAVVAAIVERIPVVQNDPAAQRKEIASLIARWGKLINQIGGIDPVETIEVLQVRSQLCLLVAVSRRAHSRLLLCTVSLCKVHSSAALWPSASGVVPRRHCG